MYIQKLVFHFSLWIKLSAAWFCFLTVLYFYVCLWNLIAGWGSIPIYKKNCYPFPPFPFINTPFQMKVFIYSTYPFLLQPAPCPPTHFLINHIFSWKSKLKHKDVDVTRFFFQDAKSSLTKHKKCLLEASYGSSQTSKLELFTKKG